MLLCVKKSKEVKNLWYWNTHASFGSQYYDDRDRMHLDMED